MQNTKNIVVAPLNWGLGHAARCIPVINELLLNGFIPILASDGSALLLLQKEFPYLEVIELPGYDIQYPKNKNFFTLKLLFKFPKIIRAVRRERNIMGRLVQERDVLGIISDNRFGVRSDSVPSVYMTHQLNVISGLATFFSSKIHQYIIRKFDECWVPDHIENGGFSGVLGHLKQSNIKIKYTGVLSRFTKLESAKVYDFMILLSGPEPQRSIFEEKLLNLFENTDQKVVFVLGKIENIQTCVQKGNVIIYNFMLSNELSLNIQKSEIIIARSGYTTIMDLAKLHKKAFFIPTPGQFEQLYLAKRLSALKLVPFALQKNIKRNDFDKALKYEGLNSIETSDFSELFQIFE